MTSESGLGIDLYWLPLGAGELWNSNSVSAWLIARSGLPVAAIQAPQGGRAPGWDAGLRVAARPDTGPTETR